MFGLKLRRCEKDGQLNHQFDLSTAMRIFPSVVTRIRACVCVSWFRGLVVVCVSFSSVQFGGWERMTERKPLLCSELRDADVFYLVS